MKAAIERFVLVTDFGDGIYIGQMRARIDSLLPGFQVIDLVNDLPAFRPDLAAYLLRPMMRDMPDASLYLCVVDPGVGSERAGLLVHADGSWLIGPDNGLLAPLVAAAQTASVWRIGWRPTTMSASFHGRDWFAPVAARLCRGEELDLALMDPANLVGSEWPPERAGILYVDRFGNLISGFQALGRPTDSVLHLGNRAIRHARTFCEVAEGEPFWYQNSFGLVEIAVNQGRADQKLGVAAGDPIGPWMQRC
jgi:S-adenosylmethionine hydrolase